MEQSRVSGSKIIRGVAILLLFPSACATDTNLPSHNNTTSHSDVPSWMKNPWFLTAASLSPCILFPLWLGCFAGAFIFREMSGLNRVKVTIPFLAAASSLSVLIGEDKLWSAIVALSLGVLQLIGFAYIFRSEAKAARARFEICGCFYEDRVDEYNRVHFFTPTMFFQFLLFIMNIIVAAFLIAGAYVTVSKKLAVGTGIGTALLTYLSGLSSVHAASARLSLLENGQKIPLRRNYLAAPRGMELIFERIQNAAVPPQDAAAVPPQDEAVEPPPEDAAVELVPPPA